MYLSRLFIKNYRSIKELDLNFSPGKNVIVGKNNAGKSNILKAIELILGENSPTYEKSDNITENDFFGGETDNDIFIWCELKRSEKEILDFSSIKKSAILKVLSNNGEDLKIKIIDFSKSQIKSIFQFSGENEGILDDKSLYSKQWIGGKPYCKVNFEDEFSDKLCFAFVFKSFKRKDSSFQKDMIFLYKENDNEDWSISTSIILRNILIQSAIIPSFRDPQNQLRITNWSWYSKLLKKYIDSDNENLKKAFKEVEKASNEVFSKLEEKINNSKVKIAFPKTNISFQFNPDTKQDIHKSALIYVDDGFKSQLSDKGSGIQSAVIIGLFHFYIREIAHSGSSLLAIEEPELYLHPHGRRVISDRLDDFLEGNKNQVIITTHSSEFLNSAREDLNIIVVKKDLPSGTSANSINFKIAKEKQILIKNQNTEMFFADLVILVEGGGDKYMLESAAEYYGSKKEKLEKNWLDDNNISVIPVIGKSEFYKYSAKLKEAGIRYYVFSDFDFFRNGLAEYLTKLKLSQLKEEHNSLNSKVINKDDKSKLKRLSDVRPVKEKDKVLQFLDKLKIENIYISTEELEDKYKDKAIEACSGLSGKEEKVLQIISKTYEGNEDISNFIEMGEYSKFFDLLAKNT